MSRSIGAPVATASTPEPGTASLMRAASEERAASGQGAVSGEPLADAEADGSHRMVAADDGERDDGGAIASCDERAPDHRWELLRALGSLSILPPAEHGPIAEALGLAAWSPAEHTRLFVLELPPYASIHLGPEGKLGGEGADRVAGVWRALGLDPPTGADHLASLLALYAHLGEASQSAATDTARRRLAHAARALLWEHLWSWAPGYLAAAATYPAAAPWAALTASALADEALGTAPPEDLPAALRQAPGAIGPEVTVDDLLDALVAPLRAGFVLTHSDLVRAGREIGVGVRRGERRFALRAMLEQDPSSSVAWLARHARRWAGLHRSHGAPAPTISDWWVRRATGTARTLDTLSRH
ncbi:MAG: molecular chaperone TorD family protein [Actinomycetota bacterium]|nr:molecular chaperone TorD family protein [Actinomycetota bacterium]